MSDLRQDFKLSRSERVQAGQGGRAVERVSAHSSAEGGLSLEEVEFAVVGVIIMPLDLNCVRCRLHNEIVFVCVVP